MKRFLLLAITWLTQSVGWAQDLNWNTYPEGELTNTYTNIGNIPVNATVDITGSTSSFSLDYPRPVTSGLELNANFPTNGDCISVKITFSQPVSNLNFNLLDIDRIDGDSQYQDQVTVTGSNAGTPVNPAIGSAVTNTVSGNTITGINSTVNNAVNSINFSSPVTEVTIQYCAGPEWVDPKKQFIYISNFGWDDAPVLPVRLASFSGKRVENQLLLGWQTTFESNSAYFVVERSTDAQAFEAIGRVTSRGFSESMQTYGFTDEAPLKGTNYYRLRQVDRDGRFEYSKILGLTFDAAGFYFEVRALDRGQIEVQTNAPDPAFALVNLQGMPNLGRVEKVNATRYLLHVNQAGLATPALKIVQMRTNQFKYSKKILLN
ncbi:hypothetical protein GCM10028803_60020 [Larkinella knui]|uniref:T9SS C-terminal target domain-containing protein n=1 Tax=Larkinella knui TaxID=2025310 RepID=A0A3P1CC01_9BACT|nr:hypothetical protein [Larkinella knui]RRB10344.1 hypothetical protein EHT87_29400 [Larkinella knui]